MMCHQNKWHVINKYFMVRHSSKPYNISNVVVRSFLNNYQCRHFAYVVYFMQHFGRTTVSCHFQEYCLQGDISVPTINVVSYGETTTSSWFSSYLRPCWIQNIYNYNKIKRSPFHRLRFVNNVPYCQKGHFLCVYLLLIYFIYITIRVLVRLIVLHALLIVTTLVVARCACELDTQDTGHCSNSRTRKEVNGGGRPDRERDRVVITMGGS